MASRSRLFGDCFELRYQKRIPAGESLATGRARLGLIVPKRLAKRAVLRNLLKRLAREAFRHSQHRLPPMDFILRLSRTPLAPGQKVDAACRRTWRRNIDALLAGAAR
jgi:ribonuclease P protein component